MGLEHTEYKDEEVWAQTLVLELAPQGSEEGLEYLLMKMRITKTKRVRNKILIKKNFKHTEIYSSKEI